MTIIDIDTALRAHVPPIGFDQVTGRAIYQAPSAYCNATMCAVWSSTAARAGALPDELALAVGGLIEGDDADLRALYVTAAEFAAALASVDLAWRIRDDGATAVRDTAVRPTVEVAMMFEGAPVSPRQYYAAGEAAGATTVDLADALRDLVDGDPTMFDAIMSA